jgi:hypothetical protein
MMPLTAITIFFATELVFAAFGVRRWPEEVTVTTDATLDPPGVCGHVTTW